VLRNCPGLGNSISLGYGPTLATLATELDIGGQVQQVFTDEAEALKASR
jgi:hypothetical protein